jgi:DNA primase
MSQYDLSRPVVARVREAADIVAVISEVISLKKAGRNHLGLCPFHGEKTPSFSVSREKGTYYCFGCKKGGDVIDFVMELERLTFPEAVERLAGRFGVVLPLASTESRQRHDEATQLTDVVEAAQGFFVRRLTEDRPRAFLERRGITLEYAASFGLGYAPAEWRALHDTLHRRFAEKLLVAAGVAVEGDQGRVWDRFRDRVTIPIRSSRGALIAFGGRALGDEMPKYLNSPETPLFAKSQVLFAQDRAQRAFAKSDRAIVVEGYFDCLALHQAGIEDVVATLGTALSEHHARELARKVPRVVVCYDGDDAGRKAAVGALRTLLAANLDVSVVLLPDGQDPDDIVRRRGRDGFVATVDAALTPAEFLLGELGATRDERRRNLSQALAVLNACPDAVRRSLLKESLAYATGLSLEELGESETPRIAIAGGSDGTAALPPPGEAAILRALLVDLDPAQRLILLNDLPVEVIDHPVARTILAALRQRADRGEPLEISGLTSDIEDREVRRVLAALEHEVPRTGEDHLKLRELWLKQKKTRLLALNQEIQQAEKQGNSSQLPRLLAEKQRLLRSPSEASPSEEKASARKPGRRNPSD